ncbi:MAG: TPM domain-containing protein [Bacteroidetes bacterium]|nr:TPM domain-containing protein [Bacteroidota bacterium]
MSAENLFTEEEKSRIMQSVKMAERKTSGEMRVHIEQNCNQANVLDRAAEVFAILELHRTRLRNGVLFYLAVEDKKFAVLGDAGINNSVPPNFWNSIKEKMQENFRNGKYTEGMMEGIRMAGDKLADKFPHQADDVNELSDDISFG